MIAVYGIKFVLIGLVLTIAFSLWSASKDSLFLFITALVLAFITLFLVFFYRNPERIIPEDKNLILSIADGTILSVEEFENDFIGSNGKKVSIFLSVFNVHINRIPIDGKIEYVKYSPGEFLKAFEKDASAQNEQTEIGLDFGSGKMIFKQIVGILARRIEYKLDEGQKVKGGDIFGMIHFGSRAELFLPENVEITVKPGQKVKAGETAIGKIKN
ncbi:MAG: phosphatidylserine decarboxylase family protein [candidate division Zixibacteria bacterium]|nr:phosphatidylserine decarboxylase family protein [candidate division Zixibacteria bacterium]